MAEYGLQVFQHTAARRRLEEEAEAKAEKAGVSTHSRPKAAGGFARQNRLD